jgi:hypothetical protein
VANIYTHFGVAWRFLLKNLLRNAKVLRATRTLKMDAKTPTKFLQLFTNREGIISQKTWIVNSKHTYKLSASYTKVRSVLSVTTISIYYVKIYYATCVGSSIKEASSGYRIQKENHTSVTPFLVLVIIALRSQLVYHKIHICHIYTPTIRCHIYIYIL